MKDDFHGKAHIQIIKSDMEQDAEFIVMMFRHTLHCYTLAFEEFGRACADIGNKIVQSISNSIMEGLMTQKQFNHSHTSRDKNKSREIVYIKNGKPQVFSEEEWKVFAELHDTDGSGDHRLIDMCPRYKHDDHAT